MGYGDLIAICGLFLTLIIFIWTRWRSNIIAQDTLMHDMVKTEQDYWQKISSKKKIKESEKTQIFNYYEYLAYLILRKKINEKEAYDLWKPNIINMYKKFGKKYFSGERTELKKLYLKWKTTQTLDKKTIKSKKAKLNSIKPFFKHGPYENMTLVDWLIIIFFVAIAIVFSLSRGYYGFGTWILYIFTVVFAFSVVEWKKDNRVAPLGIMLLTIIILGATSPVLHPRAEIEPGEELLGEVYNDQAFITQRIKLSIYPPLYPDRKNPACQPIPEGTTIFPTRSLYPYVYFEGGQICTYKIDGWTYHKLTTTTRLRSSKKIYFIIAPLNITELHDIDKDGSTIYFEDFSVINSEDFPIIVKEITFFIPKDSDAWITYQKIKRELNLNKLLFKLSQKKDLTRIITQEFVEESSEGAYIFFKDLSLRVGPGEGLEYFVGIEPSNIGYIPDT